MSDDTQKHHTRAADERKRADRAADPNVKAAHLHLASLHERAAAEGRHALRTVLDA